MQGPLTPSLHVDVPETPRTPMPSDAPAALALWNEDQQNKWALWRERLIISLDQLAQAVSRLYGDLSGTALLIQQLQNGISSLQSVLNNLQGNDLAQLLQRMDAIETQISELVSRIEDLEGRMDDAEDRLDDHEARISALEGG